MPTNAEIFINSLNNLFGEEDVIRKIEPVDGGPPVHIFFYYDFPEKGTITSVTYGLSEGVHPEWKYGKPEIITSLDSSKEDWGLCSGYFVSQFRGKKTFSYGDLFVLDEPISPDSEMVGYFIFAPSFLAKNQAEIQTNDLPIHLAEMYPIYKEEIDLIHEIGLKDFWHLDGFELYNIKRKNLGV